MQPDHNRQGLGLWGNICLLAGIFLVMFILTGLVITALQTFSMSERPRLLTASILQGLLLFMGTPAIYFRTLKMNLPKHTGLSGRFSFKSAVGIVILWILLTPAMNQLVYWNSIITFPDWLRPIEESLRAMEDSATRTTDIILGGNTFESLIINILTIGVFTGFCEEIFFRGTLQRILGENLRNRQAAIWIAALIFSIMHFQFFGLVPRILLGAIFGYLLVWTGSLWTSIFAHSLNNSIVVFTYWLISNDYANQDALQIGVTESGWPVPAIISLILTCLFFKFGTTYFFKIQKG